MMLSNTTKWQGNLAIIYWSIEANVTSDLLQLL